jgi:hypothetical protein
VCCASTRAATKKPRSSSLNSADRVGSQRPLKIGDRGAPLDGLRGEPGVELLGTRDAGMNHGDIDTSGSELIGEVFGQRRVTLRMVWAIEVACRAPRPLMLMIRPQPCAIRCGDTARAVRR